MAKNLGELIQGNIEARKNYKSDYEFPEKILHPAIEQHVFDKGKRYQHWWETLTGKRDELTLHMCSDPDDLTNIVELYLVPGQENSRTASGTSGAAIQKAQEYLKKNFNLVLRGTLHSHPGMGCFFSGQDHTVNENTLHALKGSQYETVKFKTTKIIDNLENIDFKNEKGAEWRNKFTNEKYILQKRKDGKFEFITEEKNYVAYIYAIVIDRDKHICGLLTQRMSNDLKQHFPMNRSRAQPGKYLELGFTNTAQKNWTDKDLIIDIIETQDLDPYNAVERIPDDDLHNELWDEYDLDNYKPKWMQYAPAQPATTQQPVGAATPVNTGGAYPFAGRQEPAKPGEKKETIFAQPGDREKYKEWKRRGKGWWWRYPEEWIWDAPYYAGQGLLNGFRSLGRGIKSLFVNVKNDSDYVRKQIHGEEEKPEQVKDQEPVQGEKKQ